MTPRRVMRSFIAAILLAVAFLLTSLVIGQATGMQVATAASARSASGAHHGSPPRVALQVAVGYQNIYRGTSWTPVRVTLRNETNTDMSGLLQIPQSNQSSSVGSSPLFHGSYQAPVTLPAGVTKHVTIYVPGSGVQGRVDVSFQQGSKVLAMRSAYPIGIDSSALLIGVLGGNPGDSAWLAPAIGQQVTTHVVSLSTATVDPVAQALGAFDIIVLTNVDTSQLDGAQLSALEGYVRDGGSLLIVGGPTWQETLRPLPAALLPGTLVGMRVLPNLHGLSLLGAVSGSAGDQSSAVSVLASPTGTVRASQAGVPLVVRRQEGQGAIEYLAFDPALSLPARSPLLTHLVAMAAPLAVTRTWSPQGFRARFDAIFRSVALTNELANIPAARLPLLAIFAGLTLIYVLILGPANFLILRWMGRQQAALITIPALALLYLGSIFGIATHFKGNTALVNSVSVINLDGDSDVHPATVYLSVAAPLPGTYQLGYGAAALPAALPPVHSPGGFFPRNASTLVSTPLGMQLQEAPQTQISLLSMQRWATRDLTLDTAVNIPGGVQSNLRIDARGDIAGSIHNGTNLDLRDPAILAGQAIDYLSDVPAGATVEIRVQPRSQVSSQDPTSIWSRLYGGSQLGGSDSFGGFGFGDCCDQFTFPNEIKPIDRERNTISMLSQAQALATPGEILFVGWSERSLGTFTVNGATPRRRDLNLIVTPLAVRFPAHGPFRLNRGTLSAHLVDVLPRAPQSSCCSGFGFGGRDSQQQISVGNGGSLTFEFDLTGSRRLHFQQLTVSTSGGADSVGPGGVYDWRARRWVPIDLSAGSARIPHPNRFISPKGQILVELRSTASGDLTISDQYDAVDLSGTGIVT